jgi:hypothetical protein
VLVEIDFVADVEEQFGEFSVALLDSFVPERAVVGAQQMRPQ